jgi:4'-phosphopantetheinyl transferase
MQDTRQEPKTVEIGWVRVDFSASGALEGKIGLSDADRNRAERFKRHEDCVRFITGRALLAFLIRRAGVTIHKPLELELTEHRRPFLPSEPDLAFSISHAGDLVGVAVARDARVGLDIESLDRQVDLPSLAARIFGDAELAQFRSLPAAVQPRAFFRAWTGKEAVLKAQGVGLFGGIEKIAAPFHDQAATIHLPDAGETWRLHPLSLPDGYVGCVACDDPSREILSREIALDQLGG